MNQQTVKKSYAFLKFALVFIILGISSIYFLTSQKRKLPVYNPYDVNPKLVDSKIQHVKNGHKIADFNLINQNGKVITQKDYDNKIYVADFFFTPDLQKEFKNNDDIKFLSMSVTPVIDSVSVLKAYAETKGAIDTKWNLTTGDKKHIYQLARKSFMAVLDEGDGGIQDFIHTEQFILVDKKKQIRGFYDGTSSEDIQRLIDDIKLLNESN